MTFQERWAEGPPVGEPPRAGRVLSEEEVDSLELFAMRWNSNPRELAQPCMKLIASHRILAEMVRQYERRDYGE